MLTAFDLNDTDSDPRIAAYLPRFRALPAPDPETGDFTGWEMLLGTGLHGKDQKPTAAMCFRLDSGFGTTSSSILALPETSRLAPKPIWRFAPGPPDRTPFEDVDLG